MIFRAVGFLLVLLALFSLVNTRVGGVFSTSSATSIAATSEKKVRVLLDASHGQNNLGPYVQLLLQSGFDVALKSDASLTEWDHFPLGKSLADFDVVVLAKPSNSWPYQEDEIKAVQDYIEAGGALLVIGDWTGPVKEVVGNLNQITRKYGVALNGDPTVDPASLRNIQDSKNKYGNPDWRVKIINFEKHPITEGISAIEIDGVSISTFTDGLGKVLPIARGTDTTYEFTYSTTKESFDRKSEIIAAVAVSDIGPGNGRLFLIGSERTFDEYLKDGLQHDNHKFDVQLTLWLAGAGHVSAPTAGLEIVKGERLKGGENQHAEDITIKNTKVAFSVGVASKGPFSAPKGGIFDAHAYGRTRDQLALLMFAVNNFGQWVEYASIEVTEKTESKIIVTATGAWVGHPEVKSTTQYILEADSNLVTVKSTLKNEGTAETGHLYAGIALSSENQQIWLPGVGDQKEPQFDPFPKDQLTDTWAAAYGGHLLYGAHTKPDHLTHVSASNTWVDLWRQVNLKPSESTEFDFVLQIEEGNNIGRILEQHYALNQIATGTLSGTVKTQKGETVSNPSIIVMKNSKPYVRVTGDAKGAYSQRLQPGEYQIVATAEGYTESEPKSVTITEAQTATLDFADLLGPAPVTFKVTHKGQGADAQIRAYLNGNLLDVLFTGAAPDKIGQVTREMPSGHYEFKINAGAGFTRDWLTKEFDLEPGKPATVEIELPDKTYDPSTKGWYAADTHLHTQFSFDGTTKIDDFLVSQLAADLHVMFISDHNSVAGHDPFSKLAQARKLPIILSEEITTQRWGHFNPYPLNKGTQIAWSGSPSEMFTESRQKGNAQLIQVNHPLVSTRDYFQHLSDGEYIEDFNAAEVYNASFGPDDEATIQQMYKFWNEGKKYTAVAVTDDHNAYAVELDTGTPRTYAYVSGELTAQKWLDAIKNQHAFVSFGPLVYASIGNAIPGDTAGIAPASKAELKADLSSITPLKKAVVIKNGQILKEFELSKNEESISIEIPAEDAWYLVRVYTATTGIEAMTNPIWVKVGATSTTTSSTNTQIAPPSGTLSAGALPTTVNGALRGKLHKLGLGDAFLFLVNGETITDEILARATEYWATQQPIPMTDHRITDQELMRFTLLKLLLEAK
jgi:hypothetical protein